MLIDSMGFFYDQAYAAEVGAEGVQPDNRMEEVGMSEDVIQKVRLTTGQIFYRITILSIVPWFYC